MDIKAHSSNFIVSSESLFSQQDLFSTEQSEFLKFVVSTNNK